MKTAKRQLNKHDAAEETTKRLESIMASFDAFDADMRIGTRQRREKDEFKVFTMQQQMAVLERSLHNEVKAPPHDGTPRSHIVKTLNSSFSRRCRVPMRMSASKASKEAMMDSRRLVVSSAASCLFSWRLAVFILRGGGLVYLSRVCGGCPLACWLVRGCRTFWWGSVRPVCARRVDATRRLGAGFCLSAAALRQAAGGSF